ncbi:MAG: hypothetical protein O3A92_14255 [Verrucomicrobia bacterium]|nr:hypothetical protein [Verrucomicrobiota bacterium]
MCRISYVTFFGLLLNVVVFAEGLKPREWLDQQRSFLDAAPGMTFATQLDSLEGLLRGVGEIPVDQRSSEEQQLYLRAQELLTGRSGHAEYLGKQITEYEASGHLETPTPGWRPQYAFEILRQLPSPETARVLAELFDQRKDWGPGIQTVSSEAARCLNAMLEDPPNFNSGDFPSWLQWREDVRQGKATFRFKGSITRYTFDGPVGTVTPNDRNRPTRQGSGGRVSAGEEKDQGADSVGKDSGVSKVTLVALAVLVVALLVYLVLRVRRRSQAG